MLQTNVLANSGWKRIARYLAVAAMLCTTLSMNLLPGQQHQRMAGELVNATNNTTAILTTIKDGATAQAAKASLDQATLALIKAAEAFQGTRKKGEVIDQKTMSGLEAAQQKFSEALAKVKNKADARKELETIIAKLSQF